MNSDPQSLPLSLLSLLLPYNNEAPRITFTAFIIFFRLVIQGQKILPHRLQDLDESSPLYEEVIAADGILEEFFAFDNM